MICLVYEKILMRSVNEIILCHRQSTHHATPQKPSVKIDVMLKNTQHLHQKPHYTLYTKVIRQIRNG